MSALPTKTTSNDRYSVRLSHGGVEVIALVSSLC